MEPDVVCVGEDDVVSEIADDNESVGVDEPHREPLDVGVYLADAEPLAESVGDGDVVSEMTGENERVAVDKSLTEPLDVGV